MRWSEYGLACPLRSETEYSPGLISPLIPFLECVLLYGVNKGAGRRLSWCSRLGECANGTPLNAELSPA